MSPWPRLRARLAPVACSWWLLAACWLGVACDSEPKPGDSCKPTDIRCLDPKTELICQQGVFAAAPCKGPNGCRETMDRMFCDFSMNETGDVCALSEEGNGQCAPDRNAWVVCRAGHYRVEPCLGEKGCHRHQGTVRCDQSIATEGAPCTGGASACSADAQNVLACQEGAFAVSAHCPGPHGCKLGESGITCDRKEGAASPSKGR